MMGRDNVRGVSTVKNGDTTVEKERKETHELNQKTNKYDRREYIRYLWLLLNDNKIDEQNIMYYIIKQWHFVICKSTTTDCKVKKTNK